VNAALSRDHTVQESRRIDPFLNVDCAFLIVECLQLNLVPFRRAVGLIGRSSQDSMHCRLVHRTHTHTHTHAGLGRGLSGALYGRTRVRLNQYEAGLTAIILYEDCISCNDSRSTIITARRPRLVLGWATVRKTGRPFVGVDLNL